MNRTERDNLREEIKRQVDCRNYLIKAPNGGYICPECHSGEKRNKTGAVKYYPETNTAYCHGCQKKFDVLDLIEKTQGVDHNEALEIGATLIHPQNAQKRSVSNSNNAGRQNSAVKEKTPQNVTEAQETPPADYREYYKKCAERITAPECVSYLSARGISVDTARRFGVGYDPQADPANAPGEMDDHAKRPHPAPRVITPTSRSHYVGRDITPDATDFVKLNPKNGKPGIFNEAALYTSRIIFVTEGVFDALSVEEVGQSAIATNSASNKHLLLKKIEAKRPPGVLVLCRDKDDTGEKWEKTLRDGLTQMRIPFITADISGSEKDANDLLKKDREQFIARIKQAIETAESAAETNSTERITEGETMGTAENINGMDRFLSDIQSNKYEPYKTGVDFWDSLFNGGLVRGTLTIILAAPGAGKTALCAQIAEAIAGNKRPVIYFNLEMTRDQMVARSISGKVTRDGERMTALQVMQGYSWTDDQRKAVTAAVEDYKNNIFPYLQYTVMDDQEDQRKNGCTYRNLETTLKRIGEEARAKGVEAPAVVLDYVQIVTGGTDAKDTVQRVVYALKNYARIYETIAFAVAATNRDSNKDGIISLSSGRDSSAVEYSGDYILSLNYYECELPAKIREGGKSIDNPEHVDPNDPEQMGKLQERELRRMVLRILKGRFISPGRKKQLQFYAPASTFYDEHGWIPADIGGERIPFNTPTSKAQRR